MKSPSSIPLDGSRNSRAWRSGRLATLAVLVILIPGFTATWVSAGRDHPARVSFMDGRAAYETSGDVDWNELTLNLPLVSGDRIVGHPIHGSKSSWATATSSESPARPMSSSLSCPRKRPS